jgi:predicted phosphodiesterase
MEPERIAIFSDIHGNAVALEEVIADIRAQEITRTVCLGDAVQGGSEPRKVVEKLRELDCPVIMGNADSFVLTSHSLEQIGERQLEVRQWTRDQLGTDGLDFVSNFLPTAEIDLGTGRSLFCFHGGPDSFDTVLLPESSEAEIEGALAGSKADVMAGGHTHIQWTRRVGSSQFLNPGSVGLAYNRHLDSSVFFLYPIAEYAVLHVGPNEIGIEFRKIPLDVDLLEKVDETSGRPHAREGFSYRPRSAT